MKNESFLKTKKIGALVRLFAKKPEQVPAQVEKAERVVNHLLSLKAFGRQFLSHVDLLIPGDDRYADADCGETKSVLTERLRSTKQVHVHHVKEGDLFCGVLNYGIATQLRHHKVDYTLIISPEVMDYATNEIVEKIIIALNEHKVLVAGVGINELADSVAAGRVANTFAVWHVESLIRVCLFDLQAAAKCKDDRLTPYLMGGNAGSEHFYPRAGVEEIIPLVRMVRKFGPCIAAIYADGAREWKIPDDPEWRRRQLKKLATKGQRQAYFAGQAGADLSYLEEYGVKVRL